MKRILMLSVLLAGLTIGVAAQNRSINFEETKQWSQVVEKARAENKLIFVDCYTDWCGPCKMLARDVFTKDEVADFFNANFVNAKFEMEKDEDGVKNAKVWGVRAYPTMIFVDPFTEKVVHRIVGAGKPEWLIENGRIAKDPTKNLNSVIERYNGGDRDPEFIKEYLGALKAAYMSDEQEKVASEYLGTLPMDRFATKDTWDIITANISDPTSDIMQKTVANREKFYAADGLDKETVDKFLGRAIVNKAMGYAYWRPGRSEFDNTGFNTYMGYLKGNNDYEPCNTALIWMDSYTFVQKEDWKGLLKKMEKTEKGKALEGEYGDRYIMRFGELLGQSGDKKIVNKGIKMVDRKADAVTLENARDYYNKSSFISVKSKMLGDIGDEAGAEKAKAEAEKLVEEGRNISSGMVPATRME